MPWAPAIYGVWLPMGGQTGGFRQKYTLLEHATTPPYKVTLTIFGVTTRSLWMSYLTITVSTPQLPYSQKRQAGRNRYDDPHVLNGYENGKADDYKKAQPHKRDHLAGVHRLVLISPS